MLEMLESNNILSQATRNSLVIIDELGRGTSTHDGFGLAWSIAWQLSQTIHCRILFATHFHELTALAAKAPSLNVQNYHVDAQVDKDTITFLYHLERGACTKSFGVHVARLCNFPLRVIEIATAKAKQLE